MNVRHPSFGQQYRLWRAALDLRSFTVSELKSVTGANENTIYSFLSRLTEASESYLKSVELPSSRRGRPRKRYTLTETGAAFLLDQCSEMAAALQRATAGVAITAANAPTAATAF